MPDSDEVIIGPSACLWCQVIGDYGDPFRMIVVNKVVAHLLNHFGGRGGVSIAKPHTLIQQSIARLPVDGSKPIKDQLQELVNRHANTSSLAEEFPKIDGTRLLDLGSGSGYLGGWLSSLGVRYTGVEPSPDLHQAAKRDSRLSQAGASLFEATIQQFCSTDGHQFSEAPTLITIIGVVDQLAFPEDSMRALFAFLSRRNWLNVPILVATFDPDFFLPGLPTRDFVRQESAHYGVTETLRIRDPAAWEEMFVNCGFHLIEQRPLHISGLPPPLSTYLHSLHEQIFKSDLSAPDGGERGGTQVTTLRVPPRQGPFYFWLLCPRNATIERSVGSSSETTDREPYTTCMEKFAQDGALSVIGNLGPRVYRVVQGSAFFESHQTGRMYFETGALFGQLETSCNYVSSRVLGALAACAGAQLETTDSRQILLHMAASDRFPDEMFLSLLHHLSSVQFAPYARAKRREKSQPSKVLTGRGRGLQAVCDIAAGLLQASANAVAGPHSGRYRSRILIELGEDQLAKFIHGPNAKELNDEDMKILSDLVQANVIDTFSAFTLESSSAQESYWIEQDEIDDGLGPLHIGWHAARFIVHCFSRRNVRVSCDDIKQLAVAISAFLGSRNDRGAFERAWEAMKTFERNRQKLGLRENLATGKFPQLDASRREYVLNLVEIDEVGRDRLGNFLNMLRSAFNFQAKANFAKVYGLSRYIVVRDLWAILACLLDEGEMWSEHRRAHIAVNEYTKQEVQKRRIIAYIQECVAHAGFQSGLSSSPL